MASSQDAWYLSLLGLAEYFRTSSPPMIKHCIQCLQAVFNFKPPQRVEARTHLQLGNILLTHTKNIDLAKNHLEQAWMLSQSISSFDDVKFEAASILADLLEQQNQIAASKPILRKAIELSQHNVYWHCRLIFQLAQIHAIEKDYTLASSLLGVGVDYAHLSNAYYTRILFVLSKGMLLLIDKKHQEVQPVLTQAGHLIETWTGAAYQREYLKVYFLVLQVCHYLMAGQVKGVKPYLKQLQQSIQAIMQTEDVFTGLSQGDMFLWMPKEHLYVLVYLLTVMHSMQAGYMEKAQKYTDKALMHIEKLKSRNFYILLISTPLSCVIVLDNKPILSVFQLMLLEHIIMCRLVMGNKTQALQEISSAASLCRQNSKLLETHGAQLHTLLGLYSMSMDCMEEAKNQFLAALNTSHERELWTFANLNLAIVYLRGKREIEFNALFDRINPENLPSQSHSLKAAAYYVQGLQAFFQTRYNEAKRYLRETLKMANAEDLNRLTSGSLVLLGHIFLSLGNSRESMNMVTPAMQLASKIPDVHVQIWASAILKDLHRICGDSARENEAYQRHVTFSQMLMQDHFQASQMPEHSLIRWTQGNLPELPSSVATNTSSGLAAAMGLMRS
ncbi:MAU2 chromatid cohesion factor homolog isoform X1 [Sitophilus oryzae]|uniref:MAU2 chromatid cohesion factor homolog n=1 Tax=Sitophilus oryzae TaxID=7048 RepID=A0A6J2YMF7_SITOR|nr:MAU2 chromatid cohesion factor homolog isoform X1 [Sitophilus oryzae]